MDCRETAPRYGRRRDVACGLIFSTAVSVSRFKLEELHPGVRLDRKADLIEQFGNFITQGKLTAFIHFFILDAHFKCSYNPNVNILIFYVSFYS